MKSLSNKLAQFAKVWWMITWRCGIWSDSFSTLSTIIILAAVASFVLVFIFDRTFRIFPIIQLFKGQGLTRSVGGKQKSIPKARKSDRRSSTINYPTEQRNYIQKATTPGVKSGLEPRALSSLKLQKSPWIAGDPGFGLDASGFNQESIKLGQQGEVNFAKALQKSNLINKFQSFWSAGIPDRDFFVVSRTYQTDIDCILFNGDTVYLIDLKNYKGGNVTYKMERGTLVCVDNATSQYLSISSKQSRNMEMAQESMTKHLSSTRYKVASRVVFMPTDSGAGTITGVYWPGSIRALNLTDFLGELAAIPNFNTATDHSWLSNKLASLVKK